MSNLIHAGALSVLLVVRDCYRPVILPFSKRVLCGGYQQRCLSSAKIRNVII